MSDIEFTADDDDPPSGAWTAAQIDTSVAHPARMYDYYLGGKDNYEVDREAAEAFLKVLPQGKATAVANRTFLGRAVRYLATAGIEQFLDIGTGIPGPGNTNEVAHTVAPQARIVYVDNDPIVITHARALLARSDPRRTAVAYADLREPESILENPDVRAVIDFDKPLAILLVGVLHFIADSEDPAGIVAKLRAVMTPGSYLAITAATPDMNPAVSLEAASYYERASAPLVPRTWDQVNEYFAGLEYVEPGLVQLPWWRPDGELEPDADGIWVYGGIGHKR
jgi:SAM-dependent methyltransferase